MNEIPESITNSKLWCQLNSQPDLKHALKGLRITSSVIAATIAEVLPDYTDHSFKHMDALWGITEQVFTAEEIETFSPGEGFILGATFYIHDIGMALAATKEGILELEASAPFKSTFDRLTQVLNYDPVTARAFALKAAARELHAEKAERFIDNRLPGLDRFLIESQDLREQWGNHIGLVAASHHWSLQKVDKRLGVRGRVPDSLGGEIDLGFLGCALRIIDYAHINAERAPKLDRILRSSVSVDSIKHWKAQEHITGPSRSDDLLVYASTRPLQDIDAWWTFYEMASGLNSEVVAVNEYLASRAASVNRFSLEGVKGAETAKQFSVSVPTEGFEPVDLHFKPDSMERLLEILGGKTLYGNDYFAPVRELLQNARDAILLQKTATELADYSTEPGKVKVTVTPGNEAGELTFTDNGVGMSERIISNYLLGIASNYWHSPDFFADYPGVYSAGFKPAGRFGIGFLSVFMISQQIVVETQRRGGENLALTIRGVGRRGSLERKSPSIRNGTTIKLQIPRDDIGNFDNLEKVIRAKAPMLEMPVLVTQHGNTVEISPGWWKSAAQRELVDYLRERPTLATVPLRSRKPTQPFLHRHWWIDDLEPLVEFKGWPGSQPEVISDKFRILAVPGSGHVVVCSKGFVINVVSIPGMVGLTEIGDVEIDAARSNALNWDQEQFREDLISELRPRIIAALNGLRTELSIPSRHEFLNSVGRTYGNDILIDTSLPWISVIEAPGKLTLMNPEELARYIKGREVFIAYGHNAGPWGIARFSRECFPEIGNAAVLLPVSSAGQPDVGSYEDKEETIWAPLKEHFIGEYSSRKIDNANLFTAMLRIVARATEKTVEDLVAMDWVRKNRTVGIRLTASLLS